jgi:hypothetical protein
MFGSDQDIESNANLAFKPDGGDQGLKRCPEEKPPKVTDLLLEQVERDAVIINKCGLLKNPMKQPW